MRCTGLVHKYLCAKAPGPPTVKQILVKEKEVAFLTEPFHQKGDDNKWVSVKKPLKLSVMVPRSLSVAKIRRILETIIGLWIASANRAKPAFSHKQMDKMFVQTRL